MRYIDPDGRAGETIEESLLSFINIDFGKDQFDESEVYANRFLQTGKPLDAIAAICAAGNGIAEAALDIYAAYWLAKVGTAVAAAMPMLAKTISALNSNSTVVLGRFTEGECGGYTKMAERLGAACFQIPSGLYDVLKKIGLAETLNAAWLKGVMASGARILLNFDPSKAKTGTSYAMEISELAKTYRFEEVVVQGIKCWEAILK